MSAVQFYGCSGCDEYDVLRLDVLYSCPCSTSTFKIKVSRSQTREKSNLSDPCDEIKKDSKGAMRHLRK